MNDADDPAGSGVAAAVVDEPEDDGEHHAAQVAAAAGAPGQDAVGGGMDVRHEGEIGTVACLYEEGGDGDEAYHGADVAAIGFRRINFSDDDEQRPAQEAGHGDPGLFRPQVLSGYLVEDVCHDAAERTCDKVEEAEDGGVVAGFGLVQVWEVGLVVGAEDGVDGQLAAE